MYEKNKTNIENIKQQKTSSYSLIHYEIKLEGPLVLWRKGPNCLKEVNTYGHQGKNKLKNNVTEDKTILQANIKAII